MADVTVLTDNEAAFNYRGGNVFFVSEDVGYLFYRENTDGDLAYRKTADGGASFGSEVTVMSDGGAYDVWADWDTPGDSGVLIHCVMARVTGDGSSAYRSLDTSDDSLSTEVAIVGGFTLWSPDQSSAGIMKTRGGNLIVMLRGHPNFAPDHVLKSEDGGSTWSALSSTNDPGFGGDTNRNFNLMFPGNEADSNDFVVVSYNGANKEINVFVYDDSGDSWSNSNMTTVGTKIVNQDSGISGSQRRTDNHIFVAFDNGNAAAANDVELWEITDGTTFTKVGNVVENDADTLNAGIGLTADQGSGDIFISYTRAGDFTYFVKYDGSFATEVAVSDSTYTGGFTTAPRSLRTSGGRLLICWSGSGTPTTVLCNSTLSVALATFVISSTITASANEDQVVEGLLEIVATITNRTWDADLGSDSPETEDFIAAFVSAQSEALGWNAVVVSGNYRKVVLDDSPVMYIRGNAVTDLGSIGVTAVAQNMDTGSPLLLSSAQKSYRYDNRTSVLQVTDTASLLNIFDGGGTVEFVISPWASAFKGTVGNILFKDNGYTISLSKQKKGFTDIFIRREFSTTGGVWIIKGKIPIGLATHVVITYDDSSASNDPIIYLNGEPFTVGTGLLETSTPVGTAVSDTGNDLFIGANSSSAAVRYNGDMQEVALYTSVLSADRVIVHINAASQRYGLDFTDVVRTSSTVITVTMRPFPFYDITVQEVITATFPGTTHSGGGADIAATPTFTIDPTGATGGFPPPPPPAGDGQGPLGNVNGGLGPAAEDGFRILGEGDTWEFGMLALSVGLAALDLPRILLVRMTEISEDES